MKYCFIDFEFNKPEELNPNLVSVSYTIFESKARGSSETIWIHNKPTSFLTTTFEELNNRGFIFVAFNVIAEARCFIALGLDPIKFKWIDLWLEYRCLINHNHRLQYGKQLSKEGKVIITRPPTNKWKESKSKELKEKENNSKPHDSLASACFKLLGVKIDTDHKNEIRDIIIKGEDLESSMDQILRYNESDILYLPKLLIASRMEFKVLLRNEFYKYQLDKDMIKRGEYSAATAWMEHWGYPISYEQTKNFSDNVPLILAECQVEINNLFPEIAPFEWSKREKRYTWKQEKTREVIRGWLKDQENLIENWEKTDGGKSGIKRLSLSLDAFKDHFSISHHYRKDSFGEQMVRFLSLKQQLNGFSTGGKSKNNFWDSVGTDRRVRPYFNIYKAQSARSQPSATSFIFLKSAWMRALVSPEPSRAICAIDFKSQEFLIAGLLSQDTEMIKAYQSGDVYLYTAKLAGAVPLDGERKDYEEVRDRFKSTTLGIQYGMMENSLAKKITLDTGTPTTPGEASRLINTFNKVYKRHARWKKEELRKYKKRRYVRLPCGFYMWGDNDNERSSGNCPIQGFGSSIMRQSVTNALSKNLKVIKTLHDAVYIEFDSSDKSAITKLARAMDEGFRHYFSGKFKSLANVGLDANIWGPDLKDDYIEVEGANGEPMSVKQQTIYVDGRGKVEYEKFRKYFNPIEI